MRKKIAIFFLAAAGTTLSAQNIALIATADSGRYVSESGAFLASGSLVRYGEFDVAGYDALSEAQKLDYVSVSALFTEHGSSTINGTGELFYVDNNYEGPASVKLYTWVFNSSIGSNATEWGIFTGGPNWNVPSGGIGTASLSTSSAGFTAVFGNATAAGQPNNLQAVPEPSTYAAIAGLAVLGVVAFRRRRAAKQ